MGLSPKIKNLRACIGVSVFVCTSQPHESDAFVDSLCRA
jgi:hypothetical protein